MNVLSKLKPIVMTEDEVAHDKATKEWIARSSTKGAR